MENNEKVKLLNNQFATIDPIKFVNKFNHLRSIRNFIDYFEKLPTGIQSEAFNLINSVLNYVRDNEISDGKEAKEFFVHYIMPIGNLYKENCGFQIVFRFETFFLFFTIIFSILLILKTSIILFGFLFIVFGGLIFRNWYYIQKRKCFSINW